MAHEPDSRMALLVTEWEPTFTAEKIDKPNMWATLRAVKRPWSIAGPMLPNSKRFRTLLNRTIDSTPGPDGLPCSAWKADMDRSIVTLRELAVNIADGVPLSAFFGESEAVFLAKGRKVGDKEMVVRSTTKVGPLIERNTDNQIVAGAFHEAAAPTLARNISKSQRGVVRGRQFIQSIADLDARARTFGLLELLWSILALFDFRAAFPSVEHDYIFATLISFMLPAGFIAAVRILYAFDPVCVSLEEGLFLSFLLTSGILRGCPISGALFDIAIDRLRILLERVAPEPLALFCACADDVGATLSRITLPQKVRGFFVLFKRISSLDLNLIKTVIVPSAKPLDDEVEAELVRLIRKMLRAGRMSPWRTKENTWALGLDLALRPRGRPNPRGYGMRPPWILWLSAFHPRKWSMSTTTLHHQLSFTWHSLARPRWR